MFELNQEVDTRRIAINKTLDPKSRAELGQYFTPGGIAAFMASLFTNIAGDVALLEPGSGIGSLIAAFVEEALNRKQLNSLKVTCYDLEQAVKSQIEQTLSACKQLTEDAGIKYEHQFHLEDFVFAAVKQPPGFTHVIMNPPYKKINSGGAHRQVLASFGIETVNLYTAFTALAVKLLREGGELVAILPRSFCNGTYYQSFRELLLKNGSIRHTHIFDSRNKAFAGDEVLQENMIIHYIKGTTAEPLTITSSPTADFNTDMTTRQVPYESMVKPGDPQFFIHIAATDREQEIIDRLACFQTSLEELDIQVSTGPVVDFRHPEDWLTDPNEGVPLLYPHHFTGSFKWPKTTKKPNSIRFSPKTKSFLWLNRGYFVVVKRFSSKEERHRIMAFVYDSSLAGELIGFENKVNVFHHHKTGVAEAIAKGLYIYLNSTLLDKYYRQFGGHTQVNASDLKSIYYPSAAVLERIGKKVLNFDISQTEIDSISG